MRGLAEASLPGTAAWLLLSLAALWVLARWAPRLARAGFLVWGLLAWVSGTSLGTTWLSRPLDGTPIVDAASARGIPALIVLDSSTVTIRGRDASVSVPSAEGLARGLEAIRLYHLLRPEVVVVTGGSETPGVSGEGGALRDLLVSRGVPAERVHLDSQSVDTRAHAVTLTPWLRARGIDAAVVVTSPSHVPRAVGTFRRLGMRVVGAPAFHRHDPESWLESIWPSLQGWARSEAIFHEYIGLAYYRVRGWI